MSSSSNNNNNNQEFAEEERGLYGEVRTIRYEEYTPWWSDWILGITTLFPLWAYFNAVSETFNYAITSQDSDRFRTRWAWAALLFAVTVWSIVGCILIDFRRSCHRVAIHSKVPRHRWSVRREVVQLHPSEAV